LYLSSGLTSLISITAISAWCDASLIRFNTLFNLIDLYSADMPLMMASGLV